LSNLSAIDNRRSASGRVMVVLVLAGVLWAVPATCTEDPHAVFYKANDAYRAGEYARAADLYASLVRRGQGGGGLHYNLGNCYLRMDRLGPAVWYYERARLYMPRDPDLDFNLRYARDRRTDEAEDPGVVGPFLWLEHFTEPELFAAFVVIHFLFWAVLVLRQWQRSEWSYYLMAGLCLLWLTGALFMGLKWYRIHHDARAVVIAPQIEVRAGPDPSDTLLFKLHGGTIVTVEREEEGWSLVRFSERKRGWTAGMGVARTRHPRALASQPVLLMAGPRQ